MEAERCHSETTRDICSKHEMRDLGGDAARRSDVREDGSRCWTGGHSKPSQGPTLPVDAKTSFIKGQDAEARCVRPEVTHSQITMKAATPHTHQSLQFISGMQGRATPHLRRQEWGEDVETPHQNRVGTTGRQGHTQQRVPT